ncbi:hypothetical protein CLF_101736 [Clonorchis sinensis]|uniref:BHLH domain-containing protein n=1 Tax=Clonorchis sinensis TaxID=79923 RepID=G7Y6G1_CLOSI|nr:hypothetical protein CLF_101736 [Clonorchis sinensis]
MNLCELQGAAHSVMFNVANNNVVSVTSMTARRERRSVIPLEQRQQSRRLKKQNLERRRRACISVKLNALYTLAMQLIGEDPKKYQKLEKVDILGICCTVFEGMTRIVKEHPGHSQSLPDKPYTVEYHILNCPSRDHSVRRLRTMPNLAEPATAAFGSPEMFNRKRVEANLSVELFLELTETVVSTADTIRSSIVGFSIYASTIDRVNRATVKFLRLILNYRLEPGQHCDDAIDETVVDSDNQQIVVDLVGELGNWFANAHCALTISPQLVLSDFKTHFFEIQVWFQTMFSLMLLDTQSLNASLTIHGEALWVGKCCISCNCRLADGADARMCKALVVFAKLGHLWQWSSISLYISLQYGLICCMAAGLSSCMRKCRTVKVNCKFLKFQSRTAEGSNIHIELNSEHPDCIDSYADHGTMIDLMRIEESLEFRSADLQVFGTSTLAELTEDLLEIVGISNENVPLYLKLLRDSSITLNLPMISVSLGNG